MFNVTNNEENANPNHNEIPLHIHQNGYYKNKRSKQTNKPENHNRWHGCDNIWDPPYTLLDRSVKWSSCCRKWYGDSSKNYLDLRHDPAILFLGIYSKEVKARLKQMFIYSRS